MNLHQSLAEWSHWCWPLLANHLWQATLFAALVWLAAFWLKRGPARARHALWLIASIKFLLPSALLLFLAQGCGLDFSRFAPAAAPSAHTADFIFQVAGQVTGPIPQLMSPVIVTSAPISGHSELYCTVTVIWLLGAAAVFGVWFKRRRQFAQAVGAGRRVESGRELAVLRRAHAWLMVKREVALVVSPRVSEPGVWRIWRPVIMLPEGMAERLSDDEFEAVMMHELIHVRRSDNLLSTLQMLLCCALWFHPLVWLIDGWLLGERELVCDEQVIECGGAPQLYAASLWKVVQFGLGWPVAGVSRAASSNLRRRIEQMMITDRQTKLSLAHRALIGAAALALVALSIMTGLLTRDVVSAQNNRQKSDVTGSVQGGVQGPVKVRKLRRASTSVSQPYVPPKVIKRVKPRYPADAKAAGVSGAVDVRVLISEEGKVIEAEAVSGHQLLREAAVEAAKQTVFRPAEKSGVPVKNKGVITFHFNEKPRR